MDALRTLRMDPTFEKHSTIYVSATIVDLQDREKGKW